MIEAFCAPDISMRKDLANADKSIILLDAMTMSLDEPQYLVVSDFYLSRTF